MDTEEKIIATIISLVVATILSIVVGISWNSLAETKAIESMVANGADPIAAACSMGNITACKTAERIEAYGLR